MKPMGMTPTFQVITPTDLENRIWDTVQQAVDEGWTVERFRAECQQAWEHANKEKLESDNAKWRRP